MHVGLRGTLRSQPAHHQKASRLDALSHVGHERRDGVQSSFGSSAEAEGGVHPVHPGLEEYFRVCVPSFGDDPR
ncbi:unnamed protein product [Allacma fusca]|uniref:Uncharacterized protein n=1 Tax=Allacma fusca TaxID=39272 RepID=A0A8J2PLN4_9HEXA|nr:unnamed protein product [Allacma fusca]